MPTWPAGLPYQSLRDGYQIPQLGSAPVKSEMQSGKIRMRRQFTVNITTMNWSRDFTAEQMGVFRSFVMNGLAAGTAEFTMPVWNASTKSYVERTVQIDDAVAGIGESDLGAGRTLVTMVLKVQGLV
jgi:hypothetical protein